MEVGELQYSYLVSRLRGEKKVPEITQLSPNIDAIFFNSPHLAAMLMPSYWSNKLQHEMLKAWYCSSSYIFVYYNIACSLIYGIFDI